MTKVKFKTRTSFKQKHTGGVNHVDYPTIWCHSSRCLTCHGNTCCICYRVEHYISDERVSCGAFSVSGTSHQNYVFDCASYWRLFPSIHSELFDIQITLSDCQVMLKPWSWNVTTLSKIIHTYSGKRKCLRKTFLKYLQEEEWNRIFLTRVN